MKPFGGASVALDANALDPDGGRRDALIERFRSLVAAGVIRVVTTEGVGVELAHPHTPEAARAAVPAEPPAVRPAMTAARHIDRIRVRAILRGDARAGKHDADAANLSDAMEAGCAVFITRDKRLLRKRGALRAHLPHMPRIVDLPEFFASLDRCGSGDDDPDRAA